MAFAPVPLYGERVLAPADYYETLFKFRHGEATDRAVVNGDHPGTHPVSHISLHHLDEVAVCADNDAYMV